MCKGHRGKKVCTKTHFLKMNITKISPNQKLHFRVLLSIHLKSNPQCVTNHLEEFLRYRKYF